MNRMIGASAGGFVGLCFVGTAAAINVHFVDVSAQRGIGPQTNEVGIGSGVAAEDYDRDGDVDLFVPQAAGVPNLLYRNLGNGFFEEIAAQVGLDSTASARVALWLDYDGDGRLDLFVANDDMNALSTFTLYRQSASGSFQDVTVAAGVFKAPIFQPPTHHWGGICAGDINNDGYLDIYTAQWRGPGHLFLNNGNGSFTDISDSSGVSIWRFVHQPVMADFNADGWTDIYVAVDFEPNLLWINQHNGQFVEQAAAAGVQNLMNDMGLSLGDYDNDTDLDIYLTNIWMTPQEPGGPRYNVLYRNNSVGGNMSYTNVSQTLGVDNGYFGWGATFMDADRDGDLDIAATNGWRKGPFLTDPSRFFENPGNGTAFADSSAQAQFNDTDWGSALLTADLDRDGDLDLVQLCLDGPLRILDNQPIGVPPPNHYLVVQPRMGPPNHLAIGAIVRVNAGGRTMMRPICAGNSYMSQEPAEAFFGLGSAAVADSVRVDWPDGTQTILTNVAADRILPIEHGTGIPALSPVARLVLAGLLLLAGAAIAPRRRGRASRVVADSM